MEEKYIKLRVALLPDTNTQEILFNFTSSITLGKGLQFKLDHDHLPHITLYFAEFPYKNLEKISLFIKKLSSNSKLIDLYPKELYTEWGYFGINFVVSSQVNSLHLSILEGLNILREGKIRDKYQDEIDEGLFNNAQIKLINKYGYPFVGSLYKPHLNILKIDNDDEAQRVLKFAKSNCEKTILHQKYSFNKIALCPSGEFGSVSKLIQQSDLVRI